MVLPFDPGNRAWREIVAPHRREIVDMATKHRAKNVRVFGSLRRGSATPRSDLDLLVTFEKGSTVYDQVGLQQELERVLGRRVDVVGDDAIHWLLRPQILAEAIPL